jgi:hypothetical protein
VAHACNPSHSGTEIRRTAVQEQPKPKKKKWDLFSKNTQNKKGLVQ